MSAERAVYVCEQCPKGTIHQVVYLRPPLEKKERPFVVCPSTTQSLDAARIRDLIVGEWGPGR